MINAQIKTILITGSNGFLGQHLCRHLLHKGYHVIATGRGNCRIAAKGFIYQACDLTNTGEVLHLLQASKADVIIHNAAMSKPDECNDNNTLCLNVNVDATHNLLQYASSHFIYISTDFIFGEGGPHNEEALPAPLNFYGESKLQAERLVNSLHTNACIVRPVFIYGKQWDGLRGSFLHWVKNSLEQQKPIKVVGDQFRTPTYAPDVCKAIQTIIDIKATGAYHLAGRDILSPYDMAMATANVLGLNAALVEQVTADTFPEVVKRAKRSGLTIDKAQRDLGYNPVGFDEGVRLTFAE